MTYYWKKQPTKGFYNFRSEDFNAPYSNQPVTEKVDDIVAIAEQDRRGSTHDIAKEPHIYQKTVLNHLKKG